MRYFGLLGNATVARCHGVRPRPAAPALILPAVLASIALVLVALAAVPSAAAAQEGGAADGAEGSPTPEGAPDDSATSGRGEITLRANRQRVRVGRSVTFSGQRRPARRGAVAQLEYKRPGSALRRIEQTTVDGAGRFELSAKRRRTGRYVVTSPRRSGETLRSRALLVEVRARVSVDARRHQLAQRGVKVRGELRPTEAGRRVVLERLTGKGWQRLGAARTRRSGAYRIGWSPPGLGGYELRARFPGDDANLAAQARLRPIYVYRKDHASYYGPGLYGNRTACGQTLRPGTVGVAHKRIRCGARVRFHYRGTTRRIPVIDRGPYVAGRRWDLTDAARRKLGFPAGTDTIWAAR